MPRFRFHTSAIVLAAALAIAPCTALADGVDDLMRSVRSDITQMGDLQKERDALVAENENHMKAYDAIKGSYDAGMKEAEGMKAQWDAQINRRYEAFNGMVDNFNRECAVEYVGELDEAAYARCDRLKSELEPYVASGRAAIDAEDQRWYANVMGPKIDVLQRQEDGLNDYAAKIKANFERTNAIDAQLRVLRSHAMQQLSGLSTACQSATSPEAVKYCGAIDWDGAGRGAPTIEEIAPIALMWPG